MDPAARPPRPAQEPPLRPWQRSLHTVIFESDTPAGRAFDLALMCAILLSVGSVTLESVAAIRSDHGTFLRAAEWFFTILFTVEYVLRLLSVRYPARYATSFFGIVDLMSIVPTYLSVFFAGTQSLLVIRTLRLLRVFRVLKMAHYLTQASALRRALAASKAKITVFLGTVVILDLIVGALMYLIEGEANGFTSIPRSMYWAIVTMTTVGYGDIAPATVPGQMLAAVLMVLGYGIIAVPTGIVSVEMAHVRATEITTRACRSCSQEGHDVDARFCKHCGSAL